MSLTQIREQLVSAIVDINEIEKERDHLRRALEKACEQIVDSYYYRCPNELNNWERSKNCLSACDVGTGIEADCWMQHFMEKNDG